MGDIKILKEDQNKIVMNFLVSEGYLEAVEKFKIEFGTLADVDLATMLGVKRALELGNVEDAIKKVNDVNTKVVIEIFIVYSV